VTGANATAVGNRPTTALILMTGFVLIACLPIAGCAAFRDVREVVEAQNTPGYFPKALFYCGSDEVCHYFEQETPLADLTPLSKHFRVFEVDKRQLALPEAAEFPRWEYRGKSDPRRQKMRLLMASTNPPIGIAEIRNSPYDQL
jgi:hypothetical protein